MKYNIDNPTKRTRILGNTFVHQHVMGTSRISQFFTKRNDPLSNTTDKESSPRTHATRTFCLPCLQFGFQAAAIALSTYTWCSSGGNTSAPWRLVSTDIQTWTEWFNLRSTNWMRPSGTNSSVHNGGGDGTFRWLLTIPISIRLCRVRSFSGNWKGKKYKITHLQPT